MAKAEERLLEWLRDAHAMEEQAETMLKILIDRIENYPEVRDALARHLEETRQQASRVRSCIERRKGDTSALKDITAKMVAMGQGLSGFFVGDEIVKAMLATYTFKHMEIASYAILIAAANEVGDRETAEVCGSIIKQEEEMAVTLRKALPWVTTKYLALEETPGAVAKH